MLNQERDNEITSFNLFNDNFFTINDDEEDDDDDEKKIKDDEKRL